MPEQKAIDKKEVVKKEAAKVGLTVTEAKPWYMSKTLWLNALVLLVAALGWVSGPDFPLELGQYAEYVTLALAILNLILRFVTGQPITLARK